MSTLLRKILNRSPFLKRLLKTFFGKLFRSASVSSNYIQLSGAESDEESLRLRSAWKSEELPKRQRKLVDQQIALYRAGKPVDVFAVLVNSLQKLPSSSDLGTLLEVGCSSGYYSEVFDIAEVKLQYSGCDYSEAFISMARAKYPDLQFSVEDATGLRYGSNTFDVVVSGCCLLHIPEYETAVAESVRVARQFVIFHRTPVVLGKPNQYFRKKAYGVETVEIHFNEPQFLTLLASHGLSLIATHTMDEVLVGGQGSATRTYVCKKVE